LSWDQYKSADSNALRRKNFQSLSRAQGHPAMFQLIDPAGKATWSQQ
jgi:hypothetical protein